ncbi:hypothetical protein AAG570_012666 [Ranatra chinensis]|uniref:Uncharacterized protein n=1 Tax=Ranatra chinensis TaxID=642074 RepID=A0ABD0YEM8_9HEMI
MRRGWGRTKKCRQRTGLRSHQGGRLNNWNRTLLNDKRLQVVLETEIEQEVTVRHDRYAQTQTWTVTIGRTASDDDVLAQLKTFMLDDATYYVYAARPQDRDRLDRLYATGSLRGTRWKGVFIRVRTVTNVTEQEQIVREYHVGKSNHRGGETSEEATLLVGDA